MLQLNLRFVKNAAANLVRGGWTAAVSFALPHFLTRSLDPDRFAAWSLMLQIAAYASFIDFGLQTAITRFVAQSSELGDVVRRKRIIETSITMLLIAAVIAVVMISAVLLNAGALFRGVPGQVLMEFKIAGLILGVGTSIQLVFSAFSGILVGLHRNELVAVATASTRTTGAVAVVVLSRFTHSLIVLACALAIAGLVGGLIQWISVVRLLPETKRLSLGLDPVIVRDLYHFCVGLTAWMLSMFLVTGLDIPIVGHFRFAQVGAYSIAATAAAVLVGFDNAVLSALLAPLAAFHARDEKGQIARITLKASFANTISNGGIFLFSLLIGRWFLVKWVGSVYAEQTISILVVLLLAQTIRLAASPFTVMLISCGQHAKGIGSGVAEGIVNVVLSCYLVGTYGAIGVAYGTLVGAFVSLLAHFVYTLKTSHAIHVRRGELLISSLGLPLLTLLPLGWFVFQVKRGSLSLQTSGVIAALLCTCVLGVISWLWQDSMLAWLVSGLEESPG